MSKWGNTRFGMWLDWFRRYSNRGRPIEVTMYTRAGCHLCEQAAELLAARRERYNLQIQAIDVDSDRAFLQRYSENVPVIVVAGRERFWGIVAPALLDRVLRAERARLR